LKLDPENGEYRQWVKKAVLSIFAPVMRRFLYGEGTDPEITISKQAKSFMAATLTGEKPSTRKKTKGDITREKILDAAQTVFTTRPYDTASIRQIGHEGGFDFTIIHHYFPTKKDLAEAVGERFYSDFFRQSAFWFSQLQEGAKGRLSLFEGLSIYISKLLDHLFDNHYGPAMMMQNIAQADPRQSLPAFDFSFRFYADIFSRLKQLLPIKAPEKEIRMWQYCLVALISNCVGASDYPIYIIDLSSRKIQYRQWIADVLIFLFYPGLKNMVTRASNGDMP